MHNNIIHPNENGIHMFILDKLNYGNLKNLENWILLLWTTSKLICLNGQISVKGGVYPPYPPLVGNPGK